MANREGKNTTKTARKIPAVRSGRQKLWRAVGALVLFLLLLGGVVFSLVCARDALFFQNPRFTMRRLQLKSGGFWNGREQQLSRRIGLAEGGNLYRLEPGVLRQRLLAIPGVETAEVSRLLPDTLTIRLAERLPRAVLDYPRSPWVVDEHAVVIPRRESMGAELDLPVISAGRVTVRPGSKLQKIVPAMELIMMTVSNFSDIRIRHVLIEDDPDSPERCKLVFYMNYRDWKACRVQMPLARNKDNRELLITMLSSLQSAIIDSEWRRDKRNNFNLSFEGQVVVGE